MIECRLNRICYPVTTLGYGERIGVWVQGCSRNCLGCMSPEMQPYTGSQCNIDSVLNHLPRDISPDGLTISGGEPFDQPKAIRALVAWFLANYGDDVLIYTGYYIEELHALHDADVDWILSHIAALVDGPYIQELNDGIGAKGSTNQRLHLFRYPERYSTFETQERKMQCLKETDKLFFIGLLPK